MNHSVSSIREYRACQRRYEIKYIDRVRVALEGKALLIGTAVHSGIDGLWLGHAEPAIDFSNPFWSTDAGQIEGARVQAMVAAYWQRWGSEQAAWTHVQAEEVFTFKLGGHTVNGKLDKRARFDGRPYLAEHKTTSDDIATLGDDCWQRIALDLQLAIYQEAVEAMGGERPGVLYDVVKKPAGKPNIKDRKTKERESLTEFKDRMLAVMLEAPDEYLVRRIVHRTREQQASLIDEAITTMRDMERAQAFTRNDTACVSPYGACAFLGVCTGTDQLDSAKFVKIASAHPELGEGSITEKEEVQRGSSGLSAECPV